MVFIRRFTKTRIDLPSARVSNHIDRFSSQSRLRGFIPPYEGLSKELYRRRSGLCHLKPSVSVIVIPVGFGNLPNYFVVANRIMQSILSEETSFHTNLTNASDIPLNMAQLKQVEVAGTSESNRNDPITCAAPCRKCVSMYCKSCEVFQCDTCAVKNHSHHEDCLCDIHTLTSACEESLLKQADDLEQRLMPLQNALRDITHVLADLDESKEMSKKQVNDSFDLLEHTLRHRRKELLGNIDDTFNEKQSKLAKQADDAERRARNLEEGLDVILLSLCPLQLDSTASTNGEVRSNGVAGHATPSPDMRLFFIHKEVTKKLSELCNGEYESDLPEMDTEDASSDSSTHLTRSLSAGSLNRMNVIVPCENSHITINNTLDVTEINLTISNFGAVETSHAVAQRCDVSGQAVITGFCKAGEENTIVFNARTWSGEVETTGKAQVSVKIEHVGPPDKSDIVTYRSLRNNHPRSGTIRNTWDGSRLPISSYHSKSNPSTPKKRTIRSSSREADSPTSIDRRSPLKDLLFPKSPEPVKTEDARSAAKHAELPTSRFLTPRVDYIKNGAYKIAFTPAVPGKYQISVELYGKPVCNGSFIVTAIDIKSRLESRQSNSSGRESLIPTRPSSTRPKVAKDESQRRNVTQKSPVSDDLVVKVGSKGRHNGQFSNPQGVSIDHLGRLLVADSSNKCMQVFTVDPKKTMECRFIYKFAEKGRGFNQVQRPTGIYGLPNGDIAVSDYDNKVVKIYGENGKHKRNIGSGKLMGPKGLCLDRNGHLVVVDNKLCQIMIFQINGRLVTKFGSQGTEPHQLAGPHFVAVNKENFIYVSDFYNHCVKIFSSQGDCFGVIGSSGEGCGQFNAPTGLAIDSRENLIVADWGNSRLQVFDKHGSFMSYVNTSEDPLYGPQGLTSIHDDFVAVADSGNQCVKIYRYLQ